MSKILLIVSHLFLWVFLWWSIGILLIALRSADLFVDTLTLRNIIHASWGLAGLYTLYHVFHDWWESID